MSLRQPLAPGDAAQALLLLKEFRPEPVQRCRTVTAERLGDRLIVSARQRCFDGDLKPDGVGDLASGRRIALSCENLREQTTNGRSQSHASNPHRPNATGLDEPLAAAALVLSEQHAAKLLESLRGLHERGKQRPLLLVVEREHARLVLDRSPELRRELVVVDQGRELEHERRSDGNPHEIDGYEHPFDLIHRGARRALVAPAAVSRRSEGGVSAAARLEGLVGPVLAEAILDALREELAAASPTPEPAIRWLTVDQAADYLGTTAKAIRRRIDRGRLETVGDGRRVYVDRQALDQAFAAKGVCSE